METRLTREEKHKLFLQRPIGIAIREMTEFGLSSLEPSSRRSARIAEIRRFARCSSDSPWSASFVAWCLGHAGYDLSQIPYPGSTACWIGQASRSPRATIERPERGDLFFIDRPGRLHLGFVLNSRGVRISTVEGDVGLDGRMEGGRAAILVREIPAVDGFIRIVAPGGILALAA